MIFSLTRARSLAVVLIATIGASIHAEPAPPLPAPPTTAAPPDAAPAPPAAPATPAAPAAPPAVAPAAPAAAAPAADVQKIGPLELSPLKSTVKAARFGQSTCIAATARFRVKNASTSDVKAALLLTGLSATDDTGEQLFIPRVDWLNATGLTSFALEPREGWAAYLGTNNSGLTTLSPNQAVDVQITPKNPADVRLLPCTTDASSEFLRSYRPTTLSFGAQLGIVDLDGNSQIRTFTFSDVPLQASARP